MLLFDLAGKAGQSGPRTDLDKHVSALITQALDRLNPPHAAVNLLDQIRCNRIIRVRLSTAIGNTGNLQTVEAESCQECLKLFRCICSNRQGISSKKLENVYQAEMLRVKGETILRQAPDRMEEAQACFSQALQAAGRQKAKTLELRAAASLTRLWQKQGRLAEAHTALAEVYHWFTEGFNIPDLKEAHALLKSLSADDDIA